MSYRDDHDSAGEEEEELPQEVAELMQANVPTAMRGIRACKRCGLLKTMDQFMNDGCDNCPFLDMVSRSDSWRCDAAIFGVLCAMLWCAAEQRKQRDDGDSFEVHNGTTATEQ
mmetsp:Transcript_9203/g.24840  ORF Transcript_9203/g.24840 Transcript_9203/m.24840 type:complete len:113 (-) Transcript_9203:656-994(-)